MTLKWVNTFAFAAMVVVNALAELIPIGGNTTGQVSEAYPNLFTPAPVTFAVWGVIYLLMGLYVLWQWEIFDKGQYSEQVRKNVGWWFAVSCALNIIWIFLWHYRLIGLSVFFIALLLLSLSVIRMRLGRLNGNFFHRMAGGAGFSVYFGWIIAALFANIFVWLTSLGWTGWGIPEGFWISAALLIGACVTFAVVVFGKDAAAGLPVMWAYAGILYKHISPAGYQGMHPYVIATCVLSEAIMLTAYLLPLSDRFPCKGRDPSPRIRHSKTEASGGVKGTAAQ